MCMYTYCVYAYVCVFVHVYMYNCIHVCVLISEYAGKEQMSRSLGKVMILPAVRSGESSTLGRVGLRTCSIFQSLA